MGSLSYYDLSMVNSFFENLDSTLWDLIFYLVLINELYNMNEFDH